MTQGHRFGRWLALILPLLLLGGCARKPPEGAPPPPPQVTVSMPVKRTIVNFAEATGRTEARETYEVRVRVKGFLKLINFRDGALVKKGDLLYEIDPRTFEADLESAEAEAARLLALVKQTASDADRAVRIRQRNAISEEDFAQRISSQETAAAGLRKAEAAVRSARLELSFTRILSPIDGMISNTLVTEGNLVGYNEPTLLTTVVRMDPIYVYFNLPERAMLEYDRLVRNQGATALEGKVQVGVGLAIDKEFPHPGFIDFRDNKVDPDTGTIRLRAVVENKRSILAPGLFCRVKVPIGLAQEHLLVPENALGQDQSGRFLLVVGPDNTVEARTVKTGRLTEDGHVVIESNLRADEWVIINGLQRARPGAKVDPRRAAPTK